MVGDANVVVEGGSAGEKVFSNLPGKVKSVRWVDNDEQLEFRQEDGEFVVNCTSYEYGCNFVVRVAEAELE